jgi:hypothetical protein
MDRHELTTLFWSDVEAVAAGFNVGIEEQCELRLRDLIEDALVESQMQVYSTIRSGSGTLRFLRVTWKSPCHDGPLRRGFSLFHSRHSKAPPPDGSTRLAGKIDRSTRKPKRGLVSV